MALPKTCCCCIGLRTGTLVIGILSLIGGICILLSSASQLISPPEQQGGSPEVQTATKVSSGFQIIGGIVSIIAASMLIHGVRKSQPGLLLVWIVLESLSLIVGVIILIVVTALVAASLESPYAAIAIGTGVAVLLLFGITLYYILVVLSYYKLLKQQTPP